MWSREQTYHFIGIGGIGVSAVARVLHQQGVRVQGSDVRASQLTEIASKELAIAYKCGDPFPAHFVWQKGSYELVEPEVLKSAKKSDRKKPSFLSGILSTICSDGEWDRLTTLVIGLTTAGKIVTHWSQLDEDDR